MGYISDYGLYHKKSTFNGVPADNNGWIYTAIAKHLGFNLDYKEIISTFHDCYLVSYQQLDVQRYPFKITPPMSRDELIGMAAVGMNISTLLYAHNWKWNQPTHTTIPLYKQLAALWGLRNKHRNAVWKEEVRNAYPIAFRLWWHDRYFMIKMTPWKPTLFHFIMFWLYAISILLRGTSGEKNLLWVQLKAMRHDKIAKLINIKKTIPEYFGSQHPFARRVNE